MYRNMIQQAHAPNQEGRVNYINEKKWNVKWEDVKWGMMKVSGQILHDMDGDEASSKPIRDRRTIYPW